MPTEGQPVETAIAPAKPNNGLKERCIRWGSHVVSKLQLNKTMVAANATSSLIWRRVAAAAIDGMILFSFFSFANSVRLADQNLTILLSGDFWIDTVSPLQPLLTWKPLIEIVMAGVPMDGTAMKLMFFSPVFEICVIWLYHAIMESSPWQATLGKKICAVVVTGVEGQRISFRQASVRHFAKAVTFLPYIFLRGVTDNSPLPKIGEPLLLPSLLGFAVAFASTRQQCLHDAIADTLVANRTAASVPEKKANTAELEKTFIDPERKPIDPALLEKTLLDPDVHEKTLVEPVKPEPKPTASKASPAPQPTAAIPEDMKECPACAELIKKKAKKCRYCQERFEE